MNRLIALGALTLSLLSALAAGTNPREPFSKDRVFSPSKTTVAYAKHVIQGFNMQVWLSNQICLGLQAWDAGSGPDPHRPALRA